MSKGFARVLVVASLALGAGAVAFGAEVKPAAVAVSKSVPKGWGEDFKAAQKQAEKEGKYMLLAFSGSDWCGWCVKMDREIYSDKKFVRQAKRDFVLVMIDSPRDKTILSPLAAEQNRDIVRKFGIRGYPCSILAKPDGSEVKRFSGYQSGGPEGFLKQLKKAAAEAGKLTPAGKDSEK